MMLRSSAHICSISPNYSEYKPILMNFPVYVNNVYLWTLNMNVMHSKGCLCQSWTVEHGTKKQLWKSEDERKIKWRNNRCPIQPYTDEMHPSTDTCAHPLLRVIFTARYSVSCDVQAPLLIFMEHKLKQRNDTAFPTDPSTLNSGR